MPRSTTPPPPDTLKARPGDKAVRLFLPEPDYELLRQLAFDRRTNMAALARALVREGLERSAKHRK